MLDRKGVEAEVVSRLTRGIAPDAVRVSLARCLTGELSAAATLRELVREGESTGSVLRLIDEVTQRVAEESRTGDRLLQDRVDELTRLVLEHGEAAL